MTVKMCRKQKFEKILRLICPYYFYFYTNFSVNIYFESKFQNEVGSKFGTTKWRTTDISEFQNFEY